jgi:hypothetical protein
MKRPMPKLFRGIKTGESLEDPRKLLMGNSLPRVVHIDPDFAPAAKKDATSWLGVLDWIADQITEGGAKKKAIAKYRGVAESLVDAYALAQRSLFVLTASLPQDLLNAYRREFEAPLPPRKALYVSRRAQPPR